MQLAVYGSDAVHANIASSYNNIGIVYSNMSEYSKALGHNIGRVYKCLITVDKLSLLVSDI